jgi:beta-galactosidase beta subunit
MSGDTHTPEKAEAHTEKKIDKAVVKTRVDIIQ